MSKYFAELEQMSKHESLVLWLKLTLDGAKGILRNTKPLLLYLNCIDAGKWQRYWISLEGSVQLTLKDNGAENFMAWYDEWQYILSFLREIYLFFLKRN